MPTRRIQLNVFAIPLGLAGLGGAWTAAATALRAPTWVSELFFLASLVLWAVFTVAYIAERRGRAHEYRADREHPGTGPNAAFIPVIGILLTAHWAGLLGAAAPWIVGAFVVALGVVAAQLLSFWLSGSVDFGSLHPGYFLPLVAGPFIASIGLTATGLPEISTAAFAVGIFFWLTLGAVIMARLISRGPLPAPAVPTLAVLLAPPATGGVAWLLAHGGAVDPVADSLAGVIAIMLLVQLGLIRTYARVGFSLAFWSFTFPVSATANFVVRFTARWDESGSAWIAWIALSLATAVVLTIAVASIVSVIRVRLRRPAAEIKVPTPA